MASMMRLTGRRILICGAASGIGRAVAELFVQEGARVALLDRDAAGLRELAAALGDQASGFPADIADEAQTQAAVQAGAQACNGLDGVVNSAGIDLLAPLEETGLARWQRVLDVNLTGPYLVCREALPFLRAAGKATIVNMASGAGLMPLPRRTAYCATKAGLIMFGKSLAMEVAPGIRVNTICPGIVDTPLFRSSYENAPNPEAEFATILNRYLIKRPGVPLELAQAALFLSCDESSFITGSALAVDGGRVFH